MMTLLFLALCFIGLPPIKSHQLYIKNLNKDPIFLLKINECRIQKGSIKIIHPINISKIQKTIESIEIVAQDNNSTFKELLKYKIKNLNDNLSQVKPTEKRQKRWDALGSAWKWLAGNPDADDLRMINKTFNQLVDENNEQVKINTNINNRFKDITYKINEVIQAANENNHVIREIEAIKLIVNIDMINQMLQNIKDAIVSARWSIPSSAILSVEELNEIKEILELQGINVPILDEVFNYVQPKIATNKDTILYIIQIPQIETEPATVLMVNTLVNDEKIIIEHPKFVIKFKNILYTTSTPHNSIQKYSDITVLNDACVKPLIMGTKATCNATFYHETIIQPIEDGRVLISNAQNLALQSNCGPDDRNLNGNFVITFGNCTVTIENKTYAAYNIESKAQDADTIMYNAQVEHRIKEPMHIKKLREETINNRKMLDHVNFQQSTHLSWMWYVGGTIITLLTLVIIAGVTMFILRNNIIAKSLTQVIPRLSPQQTLPTAAIQPPISASRRHLQRSISSLSH